MKLLQPRNSIVFVMLLLFGGLGLPSVLLYALPIGQRFIGFGFLMILIGYFTLSRRTMPRELIILILASVVFSAITSIYWQNISILAYSGYFLISALLVGMAAPSEIRRAIEVGTDILLVMTVLAWVSFVYALRGGAPGFEISGYPGQPVSLYLTSMALSIHGQGLGTFLRPSGIFDEPGAFAFFISLCAACRMLLDMDRNKTWFLLIAGLITTSLALVIFIVIVGFRELIDKPQHLGNKRKISVLLPVFALLGLLVLLVSFWAEVSIVFVVLIERLAPGSDGRLLQGDSRTVQFLSAFEQITPAIALFGFDASCFGDAATCYGIGIEGGGSPLQPMMMRGLFSQSMYYVVLTIFLYRSLNSRHRLVYLAVALTFMQRPYIMTMGYSVWAILVLLMPLKTSLEFSQRRHEQSFSTSVGAN